MTYYTCIGDVRLGCGIKHKTKEAAQKCCSKDHKACKKHGDGGYSDRFVVEIEAPTKDKPK
jgi:hypothetical protein